MDQRKRKSSLSGSKQRNKFENTNWGREGRGDEERRGEWQMKMRKNDLDERIFKENNQGHQ